MPAEKKLTLYAAVGFALLAVFAMEIPRLSFASRFALLLASVALAGPLLAIAHRPESSVPSLDDRLRWLYLSAYAGGWTLLLLSLSFPKPHEGGQPGPPVIDEALGLLGIALLGAVYLVRRGHAENQ